MNAGGRKVRQQARYLNNKLFGDGGRANGRAGGRASEKKEGDETRGPNGTK